MATPTAAEMEDFWEAAREVADVQRLRPRHVDVVIELTPEEVAAAVAEWLRLIAELNR